MGKLMTPHEALSRIPGWDTENLSVTTIRGGLSNRNFLVSDGPDEYVLRLDAEHTRAFPLDRVRELGIIRGAAKVGLAPEPEYADPAAGILLSRRLQGRSWTGKDLVRRENLAVLGALLQKVHALPLSGEKMDAISIGKRYADNLPSDSELHSLAVRGVDIIAANVAVDNMCCCHGDMVAANVFATPELILLDWEYACDNDPLFDIASLVGFHDLKDTQARTLLAAYAGNDDRWEHLQSQVRLYDALQWLWYANRQVISPDPALGNRLEQIGRRLYVDSA
jgi:thiamine kinase-like enzyme